MPSPRASMADLISIMRTQFLDDPNALVFDDIQIQTALDLHRLDLFQEKLDQADDVQPSRIIFWRDFYSGRNYWEADAQLQDHNFAYVTADVAEPLIGHWHFNTSQIIPLYVTGKTYDMYAAAVDLLMQWKSKLKLQVDFVDASRNYQRTQRIRAIDGLIKTYRSRMRLRTIRQTRRSNLPPTRRASGNY